VDEPPRTRKQTPRVPSNLLYERIVPAVFVVMAVILVAVIAIAVIGLLNVAR